MKRHLAALFLAFVDMLTCALIYALAAIVPIQHKTDGVKPKAEYLIQLSYDVSRDVDIDLWAVGPAHKPVFYGSRQVGCLDLDRDTLGFSTSQHIMLDGSIVRDSANVETISVRCFEPGHYDIGTNLFSWHSDADHRIDYRIELIRINPTISTVWAGTGTFAQPGPMTDNDISFDLDKDGNITLTSVPLEPITKAFTGPSLAHPITGATTNP